MKKLYYYFLLLILNTSFLYAQDILSETFSEKENTQEESSLQEPIITNLKDSSTDETLTTPDNLPEEVAILEPKSIYKPLLKTYTNLYM